MFLGPLISLLTISFKSLERIFLDFPQLSLVLRISLFLIFVELFLVSIKRVCLLMKLDKAALISWFGARHHILVKLGIHLILLFSL